MLRSKCFSSIKLSIYIMWMFAITCRVGSRTDCGMGKSTNDRIQTKLSFSCQIISLLSSSTDNRQSTRHFCFGISENLKLMKMRNEIFLKLFSSSVSSICLRIFAKHVNVILSVSTPWRFLLIFSIVFRLFFTHCRWKSVLQQKQKQTTKLQHFIFSSESLRVFQLKQQLT